MKKSIAFFILGLFAVPAVAGAAPCSHADLTRCLDSVCAINISSNPAARCQYCGTSAAGGIKDQGQMRKVSVGKSVKYTLSDKELKSAPTDPGQRYIWATKKCLEKLQDCTSENVSDVYDPLIEQSCKAAGISADFASLRSNLKKGKTKSGCMADIQSCIINEKNCGPDFSGCKTNEAFDKNFSACTVDAGGCDEYISEIRTTLLGSRDKLAKNQEALLDKIVSSYQQKRKSKLDSAKASCTNNAGRDSCVQTVCQNNMRNKCAAGHQDEKAMAVLLCKFYDSACEKLK